MNLLSLLLAAAALASPIDPGQCNAATLVQTRDTLAALPPGDRPEALVQGLRSACADRSPDLERGLAWWSGEAEDPDFRTTLASLCPRRAEALAASLTGDVGADLLGLWRPCGLGRTGLLEKRELSGASGPLSVLFAVELYQQLRNRGVPEELARELTRPITGLVPVDRGRYADIATRAPGASLPRSGGPGPRPHAACAPVIAVDVGAVRLDGEALVLGAVDAADQPPYPGLRDALAAWSPPAGCEEQADPLIAPDHRSTVGQLRQVVETVASQGGSVQLALLGAADPVRSGTSVPRFEDLPLKAWTVVAEASADAAQVSLVPPNFSFSDQPGAVTALAPASWDQLREQIAAVLAPREGSPVEFVVVDALDATPIGAVVQLLDAWAWQTSDPKDGAGFQPPRIALTPRQ